MRASRGGSQSKGARSASDRNRGRRTAPSTGAARWSQRVTRESNALDLDAGVFTWDDPVRIARSLKRSADRSDRRKARPFQSAMSMLNFYINRAGRSLSARQRRVLERAKDELRKAFGRELMRTDARSRRA